MFRKISIVLTVLTVFCMFLGSQISSQAQTPYVNAHLFTKPSDTETDYYWIRTLVDPLWGISGFMYISAGDNTYYVLPDDVNFISQTDAIVSAFVTVGVNQDPGYLQAEVWSVGGIGYAGYVVTSLLDSTVILDYSPGIRMSGRGYVRIRY